jgi:FMN phosphatase YigB (HAD superfamily)
MASKYQLISFDLQGTLSDSAFSDEFWLELLPRLYSEKRGLDIADARAELKSQFTAMGKYHKLYYCPRSWIKELCPEKSFAEVIARLSHAPLLFEDSLMLVQELAKTVPLIILSTTTHDFIDVELSKGRDCFCGVYSTLDDFHTAGKTSDVFKSVASRHEVSGENVLHVGDCPEMDIANAKAAGWNTFFFDKKRPRSQSLKELQELIGAR